MSTRRKSHREVCQVYWDEVACPDRLLASPQVGNLHVVPLTAAADLLLKHSHQSAEALMLLPAVNEGRILKRELLSGRERKEERNHYSRQVDLRKAELQLWFVT